jgi:hypothetical protein
MCFLVGDLILKTDLNSPKEYFDYDITWMILLLFRLRGKPVRAPLFKVFEIKIFIYGILVSLIK